MTLYTIGCPQCLVLRKKLDLAGVKYDICTDRELMLSKNIRALPQLELDDGTVLNFMEAVKYLKDQK